MKLTQIASQLEIINDLVKDCSLSIQTNDSGLLATRLNDIGDLCKVLANNVD